MGFNIDDLDITDEQKTKLKRLSRWAIWNGAWIAFKNFSLLVAATILIGYLNFKYLNSEAFVTVSSFLNGIMFVLQIRLDFRKGNAKLVEEINKILEPQE